MVDKKWIILEKNNERRLSTAPNNFHSENAILWVGSIGGMEAELVARKGLPYAEIHAAGVHGVGLSELPGNLWRLSKGYFDARRLLEEFHPDVLFFTGGFVGVPVALAGYKIPSLLYVPDIEPGLALKTISRFAERIDVTVQETCNFFSDKQSISVTGYPTRPGLTFWSKNSARELFGFSDNLPTLLVMGGSKGAQSINEAVLSALSQLLKEIQVLHICGMNNFKVISSNLKEYSDTAEFNERYRLFPYLHDDMGAALRVADLVLSRAGASILGEYPLFNLPALLVPYPHAWKYQQINAEYLHKRGAALIIQDSELTNRMFSEVLELIRDKPRLKRMADAMQALNGKNAAELIADDLVNLASIGKRRN